jgi:hypothetical protein
VFVHQPPISSGPHGGPLVEPASAALRFYYMPVFREHNVRLVLSGHDHLFEHWVERYRDSTGAHRLDHISAFAELLPEGSDVHINSSAFPDIIFTPDLAEKRITSKNYSDI